MCLRIKFCVLFGLGGSILSNRQNCGTLMVDNDTVPSTTVAKFLVPDWGHLVDFGLGLSYRWPPKKIGPLNIDLSNLLRETFYGSVKISSCVLGE